MRHRLAQLVGEELARDLWVGTFHGIRAKFLRREHDAVGLTRNFVIYDDSDQKAVVARLVKELELDDRQYPARGSSAIRSAKQDGRDPAEHDLGEGFDSNLVRLGREYQAALRRSNAVDFDDLLLYVLRLVEDPNSPAGRSLLLALRARAGRRVSRHELGTVSHRPRAQRRSRAPVRRRRRRSVDLPLARRRRAHHPGIPQDFPETLVVKLEQNYRSTGNIVKAALGVIVRPPPPVNSKELWTNSPPGPPWSVHGTTDERDEAAFVSRGLLAARRRRRVSG